jgi:Transglycosylase SLT domain
LSKSFIALLFYATCLHAGQSPVSDVPWQRAQKALEQQRESLVKQQEAIQRQIGATVDAATPVRIAGIDPFPPVVFPLVLPVIDRPTCPPLEKTSVDSLVDAASKKQALPAGLLRAVMKQESAFRPCAISSRGALGLMQLMPGTAQQFHVSDPFDPDQNVQGGAAFLKQLLTRYKGDLRSTLAAYNAGPVRADQEATRPFPIETQSYLANIFADLGLDQFSGSLGTSIPSQEP